MNMYVHLWYLAEYFLDWEILQTKVVEKIETHFMYNNFFWKLYYLWDNVEKYGKAEQATYYSIIRRMIFTWWITKARMHTHTHTHHTHTHTHPPTHTSTHAHTHACRDILLPSSGNLWPFYCDYCNSIHVAVTLYIYWFSYCTLHSVALFSKTCELVAWRFIWDKSWMVEIKNVCKI